LRQTVGNSFHRKTIDEVVDDIERRMIEDATKNIVGTNKKAV